MSTGGHRPEVDKDTVKLGLAAKVEWLALVTAVVASLALVGSVLRYSYFGYDFTDEGYYLNWISNPWIYKASTSQFGFMYHPLYRLVGGDLAFLRQCNIFITFGLAWLLCLVLLRSIARENASSERWTTTPSLGIATVLAGSSLIFLKAWLPTPNYNSLAFQAVLIAGIGIILANRAVSRSSMTGWFLIGIAGWLAFMAKPTTAAALGLAVATYVFLAGKLNWGMLTISILTSSVLVVMAACIIDGSLTVFVGRLAEEAKGNSVSLPGSFRVDDFKFSERENYTIVALTLFVFVATCLSLSNRTVSRIADASLALVAAVGCLTLIFGLASLSVLPTPFQALQLWSVPLGILLAALAIWHLGLFGLVSRNGWVLVVYFVVMPYVYAFGTDNNYWSQGAEVAFFWILAGVTYLASLASPRILWRALLPGATVALALTTAIVNISMEHPYRQPRALRENSSVLKLAPTGSEIVVAGDFTDYIRHLGELTKAAGFKIGDPMIDLTGHYPGALYALGAEPIGDAWLNGGHSWSERNAIAKLDLVPCSDLARSWILTEPTGPRRLSSDILTRYGINMDLDYVEVGTINSPRGTFAQSFKQHVMKPLRGSGYTPAACLQLNR